MPPCGCWWSFAFFFTVGCIGIQHGAATTAVSVVRDFLHLTQFCHHHCRVRPFHSCSLISAAVHPHHSTLVLMLQCTTGAQEPWGPSWPHLPTAQVQDMKPQNVDCIHVAAGGSCCDQFPPPTLAGVLLGHGPCNGSSSRSDPALHQGQPRARCCSKLAITCGTPLHQEAWGVMVPVMCWLWCCHMHLHPGPSTIAYGCDW